MPVERREVLSLLSFTAGAALLGAEPTSAQTGSTQSHDPQDPHDPPASEKVQGIGGFFFRAKNPEALTQWYLKHLGILPVPTENGQPAWTTGAGITAFAPFPANTAYFDLKQGWMLNFRVHDLDRMAAQLRLAGIAVKIDPTAYPNGRFAHLHDPENNPIELWQPTAKA